MPYEFTQEEFRRFSEEVIKAEGDQATLTSLLADMQTTVTDNIALVEKQRKDVETISAENDRLKASNMELFLRVGQQAEEIKGGGANIKEDKAPSTKDYMQSYFNKLDGKEK